jgi:hypothetical protein
MASKVPKSIRVHADKHVSCSLFKAGFPFRILNPESDKLQEQGKQLRLTGNFHLHRIPAAEGITGILLSRPGKIVLANIKYWHSF